VQSLIGDTAVDGHRLRQTTIPRSQTTSTATCWSAPASFRAQIIICPFSSEVSDPQPARLGQRLAGRAAIAAQATTTRGKHTFTLSGSTYAGITTFTPLVGGEGFVMPSTFDYRIAADPALRLVQGQRPKLAVGPNLSYAGTSGAGSSILFRVQLQLAAGLVRHLQRVAFVRKLAAGQRPGAFVQRSAVGARQLRRRYRDRQRTRRPALASVRGELTTSHGRINGGTDSSRSTPTGRRQGGQLVTRPSPATASA